VVSLSPSTTEVVFALGAGGCLVGRSRYCDFPPEAIALPVVGGYADPSIEAILALAPALVVGARGPAGPALAEALEAHGIGTFFPETESLDQIEAMIVELGGRLRKETAGRKIVANIESHRRRVRAAVHGAPRIRAVFLFGVGPIVGAGPGSFADNLLTEAGGENVLTAGGPYPSIDIEVLLAKDPEVILDGSSEDHGGFADSRIRNLRDAPGWRELRAIRTGRIRLLSGSAVLRPGPRIGHGLVAVAEALQGHNLPPPETASE
jgi:iron complex transport system substrate-binding protein